MLALASQFLDGPGSPFLSPRKVAFHLHMQVGDLAESARVHRNTLSSRPQSPKVQELLRAILRAISAASEITGDVDTAVAWMMNEPIVAFRHKTAFALVVDGRVEDVVGYLDSIHSGFVG